LHCCPCTRHTRSIKNASLPAGLPYNAARLKAASASSSRDAGDGDIEYTFSARVTCGAAWRACRFLYVPLPTTSSARAQAESGDGRSHTPGILLLTLPHPTCLLPLPHIYCLTCPSHIVADSSWHIGRTSSLPAHACICLMTFPRALLRTLNLPLPCGRFPCLSPRAAPHYPAGGGRQAHRMRTLRAHARLTATPAAAEDGAAIAIRQNNSSDSWLGCSSLADCLSSAYRSGTAAVASSPARDWFDSAGSCMHHSSAPACLTARSSHLAL